MSSSSIRSRVVQVNAPGGPDAMDIRTVDIPAPGPGEVRVQHHAVGLNFIDVYQRTGLYALPMPLRLGLEAAGVVESVGEDVSHLHVGDRVAYVAPSPGSYADWRTLPAMTVCRLPDGISFETGAAMMLKGLTAEYLLRRVRGQLDVEAGDHVLFHAAAGGVGLIACQWARALGLQLIGTAGSDEKCALAQSLGAAHVINYRTENFVERVREITGGQKVKLVLDSVGKDTFEGSLDCLMPFGLMVTYGNASGPVPPVAPLVLAQKGCLYLTRQTLFTHLRSRETVQAMVDELFGMVTSGRIQIHIGQRFALEDVREAHRSLEAHQTMGSTILTL